MVRIGQGERASAVKEALQLSANTVKMHLARVFRKTRCSTQAEVVKLMADLSLPISVKAPPPAPSSEISAV
jgi:DNA-binding CsgD family transcriptional regulator